MKNAVIISFIVTVFLLFVAAQIEESNTSIVTPTGAMENSVNPLFPPVTMTITETSTTTVMPKQTQTASSTTTASNDASRLFMMKSSQLAAIVVLAYLVFLI